MSSYHRKHEIAPEDRKEEKKLMTKEHIEKGAHTSKAEKDKLLGNKNKKSSKK
jgi:hypothetical protein